MENTCVGQSKGESDVCPQTFKLSRTDTCVVTTTAQQIHKTQSYSRKHNFTLQSTQVDLASFANFLLTNELMREEVGGNQKESGVRSNMEQRAVVR